MYWNPELTRANHCGVSARFRLTRALLRLTGVLFRLTGSLFRLTGALSVGLAPNRNYSVFTAPVRDFQSPFSQRGSSPQLSFLAVSTLSANVNSHLRFAWINKRFEVSLNFPFVNSSYSYLFSNRTNKRTLNSFLIIVWTAKLNYTNEGTHLWWP